MKEILFFTAEWCNPCLKVEAVIKEFIDKHPEVMYTRVDADNNITKSIHYEIKSLPSIIILENGFIYNKIDGLVEYNDLYNSIK